MITLIRCNDIITDPRVMKYVRFLENNRIPFRIIGWDRSNTASESEHVCFYKKKAGYNVGGFKAAFNRIGWMLFVINKLRRIDKEKMVLHCCDLDAAFPAVIYKIVFNRNAYVLFDVFDWFSASLSNQNALIRRTFKWMERICMKWTDHYYICEPERKDQFPTDVNDEKVSVFPNIPYFNDSSFLRVDPDYRFSNDLLTFAYVGYFSSERCIDEIISLAEEGCINLSIAGYGTERLESRLKELSANEHIKYFGKVEYSKGLNIMYNADVIYAMYSKIIPNHIYAAPNKYYEAMFLGKPVFTTAGTIVGQKVINNRIGYISEESKDEIKQTINSIKTVSLDEMGNRAHQLWESNYHDYTERFLNNEYRKLAQRI